MYATSAGRYALARANSQPYGSPPLSAETQTTEPANAENALRALRWASALAHEGPDRCPKPAVELTLPEIRAIAVPALRVELDRLLVGRYAEEGLDALREIGVLDAWLPEVASLVGFGDGEWRHKDVWKHTKLVVKQSVPRLEVRWGALLHDIGKPRTRRILDGGQVTFHGHAEVGARMFRKRLADRLGLEGALRERIHFLILYHLRASQYDGSWTDSAVRRFYIQMGPGLKDLLDLSRADITTKRPERRKRGVRMISELGKRIRELQEEAEQVAPLPKGLGNAMMTELGIPPSKRLGDLKHALEDDIADGLLEGGKDAEFYVAYLREHAERFDIDL